MKLNPDERAWCPEDRPDYLCVLKRKQHPPANREEFLDLQADLLERLVSEANAGELEWAQQRVNDNFPVEMWIPLPLDLFQDPK